MRSPAGFLWRGDWGVGPDSCSPLLSSCLVAGALVDRPAFFLAFPRSRFPALRFAARRRKRAPRALALRTRCLSFFLSTRAVLVTSPPSLSLSKTTTKIKQKQNKTGDSTGRFSGVADCFLRTAREEGLGAFYKGFIPNFARLGSWNVVMFLTLEQTKKAFQPKAEATAA